LNQTPAGKIVVLLSILFTYIPDGFNLFFNLKLNKKFLEEFLKIFSANEHVTNIDNMESKPFLYKIKSRISSLVSKRSHSTPKQKSLDITPSSLNIDVINNLAKNNLLMAPDNQVSSSAPNLRKRYSLYVTTSMHSGFSIKSFQKRSRNSLHSNLSRPFSRINRKSISAVQTNISELHRFEEKFNVGDNVRRHSLHHFTSSLSNVANKCMRQRHVSLRVSYSKLNGIH
jgi:hypothetical protein